jgi:AraC family transcriptional regulator
MIKGNSNINRNLYCEYVQRINRVLDYIESNIDKTLTVEELANIANFSRYHFQRIFGTVMGESLNRFIQRVRVEKAANLLLMNQKLTVTEIALECGFSGSAVFARSFKEFYGMSASEWRKKGNSTKCKTDSPHGKTFDEYSKEVDIECVYINGVFSNKLWRVKIKNASQITTDVRIEELKPMTAAYIRHIGPYKGDEKLFERLWNKLMSWAGPRDLIRFPESKMFTIYHDGIEITDEEKLRISVCLSVPEDTQVDGEVGKLSVPGGKYAIGKFEIFANEYSQAWETMYSGWLPGSGYQPDDRPCFELYLNDPKQHPEHKHVFEICIPVKPL